MECGMLSLSGTAAVKAKETNVEAIGIILELRSAVGSY